MSVRFCPIASGSNGNSIYMGTDQTHILIDAGLSGKRIESGLDELNIDGNQLNGIFITHEHSDHILGVGVMSRRFDIPVYATEKTWLQIDRHKLLGKISSTNKKIIHKNECCEINDLKINAFEIPHDAADPVGYCVHAENYKISVATDIGHDTLEIKNNIADSDIILLESNHDYEMLINGRYPRELKARVSGDKGHLSNDCCGRVLAEIMNDKIKYVYLGHLSEENNRPLLAFDTVVSILEANKIKVGKDLKLFLANRAAISQMVTL